MKKFALLILCALAALGARAQAIENPLAISDNHRWFVTADGRPFFWLGDTAWLLLDKLDREQALHYLDTRRAQGFNVIQVSVVHTLGIDNACGFAALIDQDLARPNLDPDPNSYWNHADWVIEQARQRGMYVAIVPVWGSNVKGGRVSREQAAAYGKFLGERYRNQPNVLWLNGGDTKGSDSTATWNALGTAIKAADPAKLMTFHPFGRDASSLWFHWAEWLDFNMFQSGHRTYAQGVDAGQRPFGPSNWKHVRIDRAMTPAKPTLDGEPSYENIPHGLRDTSRMRWTDADVRRYAYWSVFEGGAGFTYGENSIMQFFRTGDRPAYKAELEWTESINAPGARQMHFLKELMLSLGGGYLSRVPDQTLLRDADRDREGYDYVAATRGEGYAMFYTYNGRPFGVNTAQLPWNKVAVSWFDPRTGAYSKEWTLRNRGVGVEFRAPREGEDWVLVLRRVK